jgi:hypothetical protein
MRFYQQLNLTTGNAPARKGSIVIVSPSLNIRMQLTSRHLYPVRASPLIYKEHIPQIFATVMIK